QARQAAYTQSNIQNRFRATGIVPYDPDRVLKHLKVRLQRTTPPLVEPSQILQTPYNIIQLKAQVNVIKQLLKQRSQSPPSPSNQALNQLIKGCYIAMHNAALLASENVELQAANQQQKQKKRKKRRYIAQGGV